MKPLAYLSAFALLLTIAASASAVSPPVADAGPNIASRVPARVTLDGSASFDPDSNDTLTYAWTQLAGPNVVLHDANTPAPWFDCAEYGLYLFQLVVSDGFNNSAPATVRVATVDMTIDQKNLDLSALGAYAHYGDVCGNLVLFAVGPACDFSWNIHYLDIKTGSFNWFGIPAPRLGIDTRPKMDGNIIVWFGGIEWGNPWYHDPSNTSVLARNIATGKQITLAQYSWSESYSHPVVSGNKVVWLEHLNLSIPDNWWNTPYNIRGADITNMIAPVYFTVALNVGRRDPYPCHSYDSDLDDVIDISRNIVVWEADGDIFGADISNTADIKVFPICTDPARQLDPHIYGNIVVWTDLRNDTGDIYGAEITDPQNIRIFEVIKKTGAQTQPAMDNGMIVYIDGPPPGKIKTCYLTKYYGAIEIPLSEVQYGLEPAIDGNKIVWQDNYYGQPQGIALQVNYSIADGNVENLTTGKKYDYIQFAINQASSSDQLVARQGVYHENIDFQDKNLILRSTNPDDSAVVAATVIRGLAVAGPVVTLAGGQDANCLLSGFTITGGENGIYCYGTSPIISKCVISGNKTSDKGAGIACYADSSPVLYACTITGNSSTGNGGAVFCTASSCTISNCLIIGNSSQGRGGAISFTGKNLTITNSTIAANTAKGKTGGVLSAGTTAITDSIIWANQSPAPADLALGTTSQATVLHCDIMGGQAAVYVPPSSTLTWGAGNIDADPCFVNPGCWNPNGTPDNPADDFWTAGDYHLPQSSPCVDTGDPNYVPEPNETDLDGRPRIIGPCIDIGAYEFNNRPVADAGPDQTIYASMDSLAEVTLDGSASYDDDNQPLTYLWKWTIDGNNFDANDVSPTIQLPAGNHTITLIVNDGIENSEPNDVVITIIPPLEAQLWIFPTSINRKSNMPHVSALMNLPAGITRADIDATAKLMLYPGQIEAVRQFILPYYERGIRRVAIFAFFDAKQLLNAIPDNGQVTLDVVGRLKTGQYFYGSDTVRIFSPGNNRR